MTDTNVMMKYESPVIDGEFVTINKIDFTVMLRNIAAIAPPELERQWVRDLVGDGGKWITNELHPNNVKRRQEYDAKIWETIVRSYLIMAVEIEWTDDKREAVAKQRDILGDEADRSDHMIYLRTVFTDPSKPEQLSALTLAVQGFLVFDREEAGRLARVFRSALWRSGYIRNAYFLIADKGEGSDVVPV